MKKLLVGLLAIVPLVSFAQTQSKQVMYFWGEPPKQEQPKIEKMPPSTPATPTAVAEPAPSKEVRPEWLTKQVLSPEVQAPALPKAQEGPAVVPVPEQAPVVPEVLWSVNKGDSLRGVVSRWAKEAGWQDPEWDEWYAGKDLEILAGGQFKGDFPDAVTQLFESLPSEFKGFATYSRVNKMMIISVRR